MELMRHESIETTLRCYVGLSARRTTKLLRDVYEQHRNASVKAAEPKGDTLGDTGPIAPKIDSDQSS